jgi:hypothetical protein
MRELLLSNIKDQAVRTKYLLRFDRKELLPISVNTIVVGCDEILLLLEVKKRLLGR